MPGVRVRRSHLTLYTVVWICQILGLVLVRFVFFAHAARDVMAFIIMGCGGACVLGALIIWLSETLRFNGYLWKHHRDRAAWTWTEKVEKGFGYKTRFIWSREDFGDQNVWTFKKNNLGATGLLFATFATMMAFLLPLALSNSR
jgi:hypothetical protein